MTQRVIEELSETQCFDLIKGRQVGRFVFQDGDGPAAVPVNYGLAGQKIVFRVESRSHLRDMLQGPVAFEVDDTEPATGAGWSVLVRGAGHEVDMEQVPDLIHQMGSTVPKPWAEGVHNVWVVIEPRKVTGRHLTAPYLAAIF